MVRENSRAFLISKKIRLWQHSDLGDVMIACCMAHARIQRQTQGQITPVSIGSGGMVDKLNT